MGREINLLQKQKSTTPRIAEFRQLLLQKVLPLFGVYAIVFFSVLAVSLFFESRLQDLEQEQGQFRQEIQNRAETEVAMRSLKHRLKSIVTILTRRYPFSTKLESLTRELAVPGVTIQSISMSPTGTTSLTITADTSTAVEQFVQELQNIAPKEGYQDIVLSQASYQKDSNIYTMDISLAIIN